MPAGCFLFCRSCPPHMSTYKACACHVLMEASVGMKHLLKRKGQQCFLDLKDAPMQDNTLADRPMVELLTMLMHMLDLARHSASQRAGGSAALQQLVLILADGRFHEKESLRRVVEVRCAAVTLAHWRFSIFSGKRPLGHFQKGGRLA